MTDLEHAVESNRRAWDASADSHLRGSGWQELSLAVQETGFSCLDETLAGVLRNLDLAGKAAVQVGCNNGREVLSLYAFGVARAVGIDQSAAFLAQARQLAERSPHQPRFVEANAYELPVELNGQFDLLLITIGVLNWMPDIARFFASVSGLLKPGGQLAIYETHPFLEMLEPESERPFELRNDYFTDTPHVSREAIVYEGSGSDTGIASYWYVHPLGDILGGLLGAGLRLSHFKEYPHSNREELYDLYEDGPLAIPMCYAGRGQGMTCVEAGRGAPLRVVVVGTSGAGKSTFSAALAARLGCTHVELDRLYWGPGWQAVPHERFEHAVERATTAPRWVADGNYSAVRELLWGRATHVVWLNFGRWTVFSRVLRRTLARGLLRTRLSHGNRESLRMAFCSRDSILLWSWTTFAGNRRKYTGLREDPRFAHLRWVEVGEPGRVGR